MSDNWSEKLALRLKRARLILHTEGWHGLTNRVMKKAKLSQGSMQSFQPVRIQPTRPVPYSGPKLGREKICEKLDSSLNEGPAVITLSQDDFSQYVGGVQKVVTAELAALRTNQQHMLHLFPYGNGTMLANDSDQPVLGLSVDGEKIGYCESSELLAAIKELGAGRFEELRIHHTMGHSLNFIGQLIATQAARQTIFWVHDFFTICPGYFLLRNDLEYCGAPGIQSNACQICRYGAERQRHLAEFKRFFEAVQLKVIAPSQFALDLWTKTYPTPEWQKSVRPLAHLEWQPPLPVSGAKEVIRVAFVGRPVFHKGIQVWLRLTESFKEDDRYQFFLAASDHIKSKAFSQIKPERKEAGQDGMLDALWENKVDVAILWSLCPETFSFTLYESLAAGCFIITNKNSGNIQTFLADHPGHGLVLENEEQLHDLLESGELITQVKAYQRAGIPQANLILN